jgi:hypothetical protein
MDLFTARYFPIPWIFPENVDSDAIHNMIIPMDPDNPVEALNAARELNLTPAGWTCDPFQSETDYLCLFTGGTNKVCCIVSRKGLRFIAESLRTT